MAVVIEKEIGRMWKVAVQLTEETDVDVSLIKDRSSDGGFRLTRPVFRENSKSVSRSPDRSWTYWSGADYVVEHIPKSLRLERVTFHKLLRHGSGVSHGGHGKDNFSYVLMCDVAEALADINHAREFVDTLKYRQCGVTSMYAIDHFF